VSLHPHKSQVMSDGCLRQIFVMSCQSSNKSSVWHLVEWSPIYLVTLLQTLLLGSVVSELVELLEDQKKNVRMVVRQALIHSSTHPPIHFINSLLNRNAFIQTISLLVANIFHKFISLFVKQTNFAWLMRIAADANSDVFGFHHF
jgi:hypothetical protein